MKTGFKSDFPGSISKYGLKPDLATWGKGIANGYSFCALTGKKEIMDLGGIRQIGEEKLFLISTTHGGETHGLAACMATIDVFKQHNVIEHNHEIGSLLIKKSEAIIQNKGLSNFINVTNCNWLIGFSFKNKNEIESAGLKTLFCQEMIKRGVLFQGLFVPCFSHTKNDVDHIVKAIDESLDIYIKAMDLGYESFLVGEAIKPVFRKFL
jgi:glutamate-1-semialdehyde aminotransferase